MSVFESKLIELPKVFDARGGLCFVEAKKHIPFEINRIYYLFNPAPATERGAHAHKALEQLIIAISGSFEIVLDDGYSKKTILLDKPWEGLYVPRMIWRDLKSFSSDAVCLVLASEFYDEADYFRDYNDFLKAVGAQ